MGITVTNTNLAERLLETIDWFRLRSANGDGLFIKEAIEQLLTSKDSEAAGLAYWRIENHAAGAVASAS